MGQYVSLIVSVAGEKTKEQKSLPWFLGVIRKKCGDSGVRFAETWMRPGRVQ